MRARSVATATLTALALASLTLAQPTFDTQSEEFQLFGGLTYAPSVPAPREIIGHDIGDRFVRHHHAVEYIHALAEASDRVTVEQYGWTHQQRPLYIFTITDPDNHANLDDILARNLELTDPTTTEARAAEIARSNPAISWLSYNVHGNEASCTDAALQVAFALTASTNDQILEILRNTVVVIDPCLNPDGRERYVSFFDNNVGAQADPNNQASEHREPWPGGRSNHYLFDLNRDWVWGVHPESRARVAIYRRFMPQLHVDYHEQGMHSPYFFGAGDTPYNANIPAESKDWFDRYGRASARAFDAQGLPYATKERFDYLYPGYGKVLPVYHGAVGLLCEQGGHGRGGLVVTVDDDHGPGIDLTLRRRALNHFITSFAFLELTASQRQSQLERFARYFRESTELETGSTTAFILSADSDQQALQNVLALCERQGIEIHQLRSPAQLADLRTYAPPFAINGSTDIPAGSWIIPAAQRMGRLARALFERDTHVENIDTYDITSWPVPALFGVVGYEFTGDLSALDLAPLTEFAPDVRAPGSAPTDALALLVPSNQHRFPEALAAATRHDLFARLTDKPITLTEGDDPVAVGSLLVHTFRNHADVLDDFVFELQSLGLDHTWSAVGYPASGPALGNNANHRFITPKIILARGEPLSSLSFGHTWHLLDIESPAPHSTVNVIRLSRLDLDDVNVLVLPSSGGLSDTLDESGIKNLDEWVRAGGTVVALARSAHWISRELLELDRGENAGEDDDDDQESDDEDGDDDEDEDLHTLTWQEREDREVVDRIPGAVLHAILDTTHPLSAGMSADIAFHMFRDDPLPVADDGHVLARFGPFDDSSGAPRIGGSISAENLAELAGTPAVTHHHHGRGVIIAFASDPTNRAMNKHGMRLLLNTILLGPSMSPALQPLGGAHEHE